jgi:hypothetical protein
VRRLLPLSILALAACADSAEVTAPAATPPRLAGPAAVISDAAHDPAADARFVFLPPLVSGEPTIVGALDAALLPRLSVRVCALSGGTCGATVAVLTATPNENNEAIRIADDGSSFHLVWKSRNYGLNAATTYRIEVWTDLGLASAKRYGFADVTLVQNGKGKKTVDDANFVALLLDGNLNIKFHIARLFDRYVSMGNSLTAGFMSNGINATTQMQAYPVLLAQRFGIPFNVPLLALPGCPAPFTAPLTPAVGTPPCAGRANGFLPPNVHNVAVPGVRLAEALTFPTGQTGLLQTLLLGPNTQVQAMQLAQPSFVSVLLGDNDVLQATLRGHTGAPFPGAPDLLTPLAAFQTSYAQLAAALNAVPTLSGAVLIGVFDPIFSAPIVQPGAFVFLARDPATGQFRGKLVNNNCSPVNALGQPNPLAANLIAGQIVVDPAFPEINCDPAAYPVGDPRRGVYVLDPAEQLAIHTRVVQFNAVIAATAAANGWAFVDPNPIVAAILATRINGRTDLLRKCQDLATATTPAQFQAAVLNTCPVTGPTAAPNFFGSYISFDGVHPSALGHVAIANTVAAAINAKYGTALPLN